MERERNEVDRSGGEAAQEVLMDRLMKLAEVLQDIAKNATEEELMQSFDLCWGFAERIGRERLSPEERELATTAAEQSVHGPN
jgi:hypothetical protein